MNAYTSLEIERTGGIHHENGALNMRPYRGVATWKHIERLNTA